MYTCMGIYVYKDMYIYVYMYVYIDMYTYLYIRVFLYRYVYICITYAYTYTGNTIKDMISSNTTEEDSTPATGVFDGSNIRVTDSDGNWMCFDDDVVTAVPLDALESTVVTEAAYVLFYRRRQLTSSNIVNFSS
jgi:hypothetical protein